MVVLLPRFVPNQRCTGCGAIGYCEDKLLLCFYCFGLRINVEIRKEKLVSTLAGRFASLRFMIRKKLEQLRQRVRN